MLVLIFIQHLASLLITYQPQFVEVFFFPLPFSCSGDLGAAFRFLPFSCVGHGSGVVLFWFFVKPPLRSLFFF